MADHNQDPIHPTPVAAGHPTALVDHIDSDSVHMTDLSGKVAQREAGTGSAGGRVEGADQQDGSNLTRAVGYSCLRRTCKFRNRMHSESHPSERLEVNIPSLVAVEEMCKSLVVRRSEITLLRVILLYPARWQRTRVYWE